MTDEHFDNLIMDERIRLVMDLACAFSVPAYLVGGSIRDAVMGRPVRDFDFALGGAVCELPMEFASRCGGHFFWLDRERQQSRVVTGREGERLTFDFAPLRGSGISEDLLLRDFTVNSLALELTRDDLLLVDPLDGMDDIRTGAVRVCRPEAFSDDPLRMLRAFRFAATLSFKVDDRTLVAIKADPSLLDRVAGERVREEFFLILGAPEVERSLGELDSAGILARIIPAADFSRGPGNRIAFAAKIERLAMDADRLFHVDGQRLKERLQRNAEGDVPVLSLVKLAALLAGEGWKDMVSAAVSRLKLGNKARDALRALCGCLDDFPALPGDGLAERPCFRFFRDRQPAGAELLLMPLASGIVSSQIAERMISFYFHSYRPGEGDLLLSGDEVMALLNIPQGPGLGREMERLREAESLGLVATGAEARDYLLKKQLTNRELMG
ncbi:MAG: CCA tRNA nucleotidyltransferase [Geobacteraceae bacterium]|nr:CCA tRNA nucleotidyltransferase [Geobacteraceae bacterium]